MANPLERAAYSVDPEPLQTGGRTGLLFYRSAMDDEPATEVAFPDHVNAAGCDLCEAARITPWFHEDDICWIAECEICAVPMVVWRSHGVKPPGEQLTHMHHELARVVTENFTFEHYVDDNMRNIPDHYHAHARPQGGFFGHGLKRRTP